MLKSCSFEKLFSNLNLPHSTLGKKDIALIFLHLTKHTVACSGVAFLQTAGQIIFRVFSSECHNSLVFAARQIANNMSPIAESF